MIIETNDELYELLVRCKNEEEFYKVQQALQSIREKIKGFKYDRTYMIELSDILYIDTVDKKTFCYTMQDVYEISYRLYELEETLDARFIRINKSCILNMEQLDHIRADFGGRIMCTLSNQETLSVSRQYAQGFKRKLGGR